MKQLKIRKELFWDVDPDRFNEDTNRRLITEQVFCYGTIDEITTLFSFYGMKTVKEEIKKAGSLDKKTLEFASTLLNIPKDHFKCYIKRS